MHAGDRCDANLRYIIYGKKQLSSCCSKHTAHIGQSQVGEYTNFFVENDRFANPVVVKSHRYVCHHVASIRVDGFAILHHPYFRPYLQNDRTRTRDWSSFDLLILFRSTSPARLIEYFLKLLDCDASELEIASNCTPDGR